MYNIAIDGPAGAGKSTIAKLIAKELKYIYVDTGAMYRAIAIFYMDKNVDPMNEEKINSLLDDIEIKIEYKDGVQQVILNGINVTNRLRTEEVGKMASVTSKYKLVRSKLVKLQQKIASDTNVVMDGRDIGTKVLPDAFLKIYLTASADARAKRRYDELVAKGEECDYKHILDDIILRDHQDMTRAESPLTKAEDAYLVDTSDMTIDEVVSAIKKLMKDKQYGSNLS